jgi:hypothetical protein
MADDDSRLPVGRVKDGRTWRIGTDAEVAWIADGTSPGLTITSAIPPVFDAYATIVSPNRDDDRQRHDRAVLAVLSERPAGCQCRGRAGLASVLVSARRAASPGSASGPRDGCGGHVRRDSSTGLIRPASLLSGSAMMADLNLERFKNWRRCPRVSSRRARWRARVPCRARTSGIPRWPCASHGRSPR